MAAALELGLDSFSMHGIAERLGVTTPALYSHVAGRQQVLDLVNEQLVGSMRAFQSSATSWRRWLTDFAGEVHQHMSGSAATVMDGLDGPAGALQVGVGERGLQLLMDAGLTPVEAGVAMWLVFRVALTSGRANGTSLRGYVDASETVLSGGQADELPATLAVHRAFGADPSFDTFEIDLEIVLDGVDRRIRSVARRSPMTNRTGRT